MHFEFEVEGRRVPAEAEWIRGQLWVYLDGRVFVYESPEQQSGKPKVAIAAGVARDLAAPMPGKITKLLVQAGDRVQRGQVVLVMEAMKMEYTLKSDGPGLVENLHCAVGEQVALGKLLVHIKPEGEGAGESPGES